MTKLLNLPGVLVEDIHQTDSTLIFFVKSDNKIAVCPRCDQTSRRLHQNQRYLVKDLPLSNREVILSVNRRRFKCENCAKPEERKFRFCTKKEKFYLQIWTNSYSTGCA
ncbi:MAG TPA: transposase family protein [Oculatellaceae cyanobacterium]